MKIKNSIKILLIIEVQIILLVQIVAAIKTETLDNKVYNTNKFVYEVLTDKRIEELNIISNEDIVVGDADAQVTIFLYSRFDCSACNSFFKTNYERLKTEFIDKGMVKLVVRYLVHESKPKILYTTKCAYYAYKTGYYNSFVRQLDSISPTLDTAVVQNIMLDLIDNSKNFNEFTKSLTTKKELLHIAMKARKAGIKYTPTIFINNQRLIGNRKYEKLKSIILAELDNDVCE